MHNKKHAIAGILASLFLNSSLVHADTIEKKALTIAGITVEGAFDLNTATQEQLMSLPGIGKSKALAILNYRSDKGYFHEVEQLKEVKGIGEKLLNRVRDKLKVVKH